MPRSIGRQRNRSPLSVEGLEGRALLSLYTGPSSIKPIVTKSAIFQVTVTGGGYEKIGRAGHGVYNINLIGTTPNSTLSINLVRTRPHFKEGPVGIGQINIQSGQIGAIDAQGTGVLLGTVTPINNSVSSIQFAGIGPNAKLDVNGALGSLNVGGIVDLTPSGHINVAGGVSGQMQVGGLLLDGGQIHIGGGIAGGAVIGALTVQNGGALDVGGDVKGGLKVSGDLNVDSNGAVDLGSSLDSLDVGHNLALDTGGRFSVGNDATGAMRVGNDMTLSNGASFHVSRDALGGLTVQGNLVLDTGANLTVGRDLDGLTVLGNITVKPAGGAISVGGNLNNLKVTGAFQGKENNSPDLNVGLDLNNLTVLGGGADQGGLQGVNFNVQKNIVGINILHGIFNSFITAGVLIDGGTQSGASGGNIGPDGTEAIFNSEIRAGAEINHLVINGDVVSDFPTNPNPTGRPTRIIAGEDRSGNFRSGALIDHFQILGTLVDSVIAASVKPYGDSGKLPSGGYNSATPGNNTPGDGGFNTYDKPHGTVAVGTFSASTPVPNYTELSYYNEKLVGVSWDPTDPTIDDTILPGAINPSFASTPAVNSQISVTNTSTGSSGSSQTSQSVPAPLAIPTTSTVLGGVVSTQHGDQFDYAGLLAADTSGVFIGQIPRSQGG